MPYNCEKLIFAAVGFGILPIILLHFKKKKYKKLTSELALQGEGASYNLIFVTYRNFNCSTHIYFNNFCSENCSNFYLETILASLSCAKYTISLCVLLLTLKSIYQALLDAQGRKVTIRIICDREMAKAKASKITDLINAGIKVKVQPDDSSMLHHKFCLVDEDNASTAKLWFGSMNLTLHGFCNNWDNIVITDDAKLIGSFKEGFEDMWNIF